MFCKQLLTDDVIPQQQKTEKLATGDAQSKYCAWLIDRGTKDMILLLL